MASNGIAYVKDTIRTTHCQENKHGHDDMCLVYEPRLPREKLYVVFQEYVYESFSDYNAYWTSKTHEIQDTRLVLQYQSISESYEIWEDRASYAEVTVQAEVIGEKNIVAYETVPVTGEETVFTTQRIFEDAGQQAFGDFDTKTLQATGAITIQSGAHATLNGVITSTGGGISVDAGGDLTIEGILPAGADPASTQKARAELIVEDSTQSITLSAAGQVTIADSAYLGSVDQNEDDAAAQSISVGAGSDLTLSGTLFADSGLTALAGQGTAKSGSIYGDIYSNLYATGPEADMSFSAGQFGGDINLNGAALTAGRNLLFSAPAGAVHLIDAPMQAAYLQSTSLGGFNAGASATDGKIYLTSAVAQADIEVTGAGDITFFNASALTLDRFETPSGAITLYNVGDVTAQSILAPGDVTLIMRGAFSYPDAKVLQANKLHIESNSTLNLLTDVNTLAARVLTSGDVSIVNQGTGTLTLDGFEVMNGNLYVQHLGGDMILADVVMGANKAGYKVEMVAGGDIQVGYLRAGHYYTDAGSVPNDSAAFGTDPGVTANVDVILISQAGSIAEFGNDPAVDLVGDQLRLTAVNGITGLEIAANGLEYVYTANGEVTLAEVDGEGEKTLALMVYDVQAPNGNVSISAEHDLFVFHVVALDDLNLEATNGLLSIKQPTSGAALESTNASTTFKNISLISGGDLKTYQFFEASQSITYIADGLFDFNFTEGQTVSTGTVYMESTQTIGINKVNFHLNGDMTVLSDASVYLFGDLYGVNTLTVHGRGQTDTTGIVRVVSETHQDVATYDLRGDTEVYLERVDASDIIFNGYLGGIADNTNSASASFVTYGGFGYKEASGSGIYGDQMVIKANLLRDVEKALNWNFNRALNLTGESQFFSGAGDLNITTQGGLVMPEGTVSAYKYNVAINPNGGRVEIGQVAGVRWDVKATGRLKAKTTIDILNAVMIGTSTADFGLEINESDDLVIEQATALGSSLSITALGSITSTLVQAYDIVRLMAADGDNIIAFVGVDPTAPASQIVLTGLGGDIREVDAYDPDYDLIGRSVEVSAFAVYLNPDNKVNLLDETAFNDINIFGLVESTTIGLEFDVDVITSKIDPRTLDEPDMIIDASAINSFMIIPNAPLEIINTGSLTFTPEALAAMASLTIDGQPAGLTDLIVRARSTLTVEAIPADLPVTLDSGGDLFIKDGVTLNTSEDLSLLAAGGISQQNGDPVTVDVVGKVNVETGSPGDVKLQSVGDLNVGTIKANGGAVALTAPGAIAIDKIDAGTTGNINLNAGGTVGAVSTIKGNNLNVTANGGVSLTTQVGQVNINNTAPSGEISITQSKQGGSLNVGVIQQAAGNTDAVSLTTGNGSIVLPSTGTFSVNGDVNFNAQGDGADVQLGQQLNAPDGVVTIHADGGNIIGSAQLGVDIIAQELNITVGHQAGSATNPLKTQVNKIGGEAYNSTIVIHNTGDLEITGSGLVTSDLGPGTIQVVATGNMIVNGDVALGADGTIHLEAQGGFLKIHNNVSTVGGTITLIGQSIEQKGTITTNGAGTVTVTATAGAISMTQDTTATTTELGAINYSATGDISLAKLVSTSPSTGSGQAGTITVSAGSGVSVEGAIKDNLSTEDANIATTGEVNLTAETGIGGSAEADIDTAIDSLNAYNLTSGDIVIHETDGLTIPIGSVKTQGGDGNIDLTVQAGNLVLDGVLSAHGSGVVTVDVINGDLTLNANVSSTSEAVSLTANNITLTTNISTSGTLDLNARNTLFIADNLTITSTLVGMDGLIQIGSGLNDITALTITGDLKFKADSQITAEINGTTAGANYDVITVSGSVTIVDGAQITVTEGFTPTGGEVVEIVNATTATTGTFTGYPEGMIIDEDYNGSGLPAVISYAEPGVAIIMGPKAIYTISDVTLVEGSTNGGNTAFEFTITRDNNYTGQTIGFATSDVSAVAGSDYTAQSNTLAFAARGDLSKTVSILVNHDLMVEIDETFKVMLSNLVGHGEIDDGEGLGTITNDDSATLSISAPAITEGDSDTDIEFTVTLDNPVQDGFDLAFSHAVGSAETIDYTVATNSLTFAGNAAETQKISVTIRGDDVVEDHETFTITLGDVTNTTATQDAAITTGDSIEATINNDDSAVITVIDVAADETDPIYLGQGTGITSFVFKVTLSHAVEAGLSVAIATVDDTALIGNSDYYAASTTLNFAGALGEQHTFTVTVNGDNIVELDETFDVILGALSNVSTTIAGVITTVDAVGTIQNDDSPVLVELNADDNLIITDQLPGGADFTIVVKRDGTDLVVSDANIEVEIHSGMQVSAYEVRIPYTAFSGGTILLDAGDGDDLLTVDFSGGDPIPTNGLAFNGQGQTPSAGSGGDALALSNGTVTTVTHTFTSANDGTVDIDGSVVTYTGLEPISDTLTATNRIFTFNGGAETITLSDDGSSGNGSSKIDSPLSEVVIFANPTASLTVNAGAGDDTVDVSRLDSAFSASLSVNGDAGADTFNLVNALPTLASLMVDAEAINIDSGAVTSTGTQTYLGAVTLGENTALTASAVTFNNTVAGGTKSLTITGNADFDDTVSGLDSLNVSGTTQMDGGAVSSTGTQTYQGAVTQSMDTTLTGSLVTFNSTFAGGSKSLTITGNADFDAPVSGLTTLNVSGTTQMDGGVITSTATQT